MKTPVSVILIRENAEQVTGGGCCGSLDDDDPTVRGRDVFRHSSMDRRDMGILHRTIREFFPPADGRRRVEVVTVDPRNQLYLAPKLVSDVIRYLPGWGPGLQTALQFFSLPAVVINGRVVGRPGKPPDPDMVCHTIGELLARF